MGVRFQHDMERADEFEGCKRFYNLTLETDATTNASAEGLLKRLKEVFKENWDHITTWIRTANVRLGIASYPSTAIMLRRFDEVLRVLNQEYPPTSTELPNPPEQPPAS